MTEVEYTVSGVPKVCPGCGHPFHSAGNCHGLQAGRCPCEVNMAVHLDIPDQPQQHGVGGVEKPKTLLDGFGEATEQVVTLRAEIARLRARCASLEAVVKIYAEPFNWFQTIHMQSGDIPVNVWAWDDARVPWSMAAAALDQHVTTTQEGME